MNSNLPRAIDINTAAKEFFGRSGHWLKNHLPDLYRRGFPRPLIEKGQGAKSLFDSVAINAWFDSYIPAQLRDAGTTKPDPKLMTRDWSETLNKRAKELHI